MRPIKKVILIGVAVLVLIFAAVQVYNLFHYRWFDGYKDYITGYSIEEGTPFRAAADNENHVPGMVLVTESEFLKLYTNTNTAEVAVYDKRTGQTTYSNPQDADEDRVASKINKAYLKSQVIVDYYDANRLAGNYNSYDYAVSNGQIEAESLASGIRYTYTLGDMTSSTGIVPIYISEERMTFFTSQMDETESRYITARYRPSNAAPGFFELNETSRNGASTLRKMTQYFESVGYTAEDYEADMLSSGVEGAVPVSFVVALEYRLEGDSLVVNAPVSLMREMGGASINRIQLLRYFGAAGENEQGYMVVPNGSGSLIHFNNGKTTVEDYSQYVYGIDPMFADYTVIENTEKARLPVFGLQKDGQGIFVEIEKGESLAQISASVSGNLNAYNYVYTTFLLRTSMSLSTFGTTGNEADLPVMEKEMYDTNIQLKYSFLTDEHKGYAGMANYYRASLIERGVLTKLAQKDSIPFYMDIIGGVKSTEFFLGIRYMDVVPMTSYKQAGEIVDTLQQAGIHNQVLNYQGWFNGGFYHNTANRIKLEKSLGSKSALADLTQKVEQAGGKLYGDVAFQKVTYIAWGKNGYNYRQEAARYYVGFTGSFGAVNPTNLMATSSMGYMELAYELLSPKFLSRYTRPFAEKIQGYDMTGISLRDLGDVLHADKKRTEYIDREEARDVVVSQLSVLQASGKDLMIAGGNAYALGFADDLQDVPLGSNSFYAVDDEIPFYQMVLHGYVDYTGGIINLSDTYKRSDIIARLIAYGASPRFAFSYEPSSKMKYTGLNRYHSVTFDNWKQDAIDIYTQVNSVLQNVIGSAMINHEILAAGVTRITYDNGFQIIVNTSGQDVRIDGEEILADSYKVGRLAK